MKATHSRMNLQFYPEPLSCFRDEATRKVINLPLFSSRLLQSALVILSLTMMALFFCLQASRQSPQLSYPRTASIDAKKRPTISFSSVILRRENKEFICNSNASIASINILSIFVVDSLNHSRSASIQSVAETKSYQRASNFLCFILDPKYLFA